MVESRYTFIHNYTHGRSTAVSVPWDMLKIWYRSVHILNNVTLLLNQMLYNVVPPLFDDSGMSCEEQWTHICMIRSKQWTQTSYQSLVMLGTTSGLNCCHASESPTVGLSGAWQLFRPDVVPNITSDWYDVWVHCFDRIMQIYNLFIEYI